MFVVADVIHILTTHGGHVDLTFHGLLILAVITIVTAAR